MLFPFSGTLTSMSCNCDCCCGACCLADSTCARTTSVICGELGGTFQGLGTTCDGSPCGDAYCVTFTVEYVSQAPFTIYSGTSPCNLPEYCDGAASSETPPCDCGDVSCEKVGGGEAGCAIGIVDGACPP